MSRPDASSAAASRITPEVLGHLQSWQGRTENLQDTAVAGQVRGLAAALDRADLADAAPGQVLPALWHWLYFLPRAQQSGLGTDGHPRLGGFMPPVPLERRMWAGGRLRWHAPLCVGDELQRSTEVVSVKHKSGRSGDLLFVVLRHQISSGGVLAITEEQDIVYRAPAQPGELAPPPRTAEAKPLWVHSVTADPVLLFRYSALTFNGHRIHYDRPYATQVEGYPGLVVHGPLLATLLAELACREQAGSRLASLSFKAVRPMTDLHAFRVCGRPSDDGRSAALWTEDHQGFVTMQADVEFVQDAVA